MRSYRRVVWVREGEGGQGPGGEGVQARAGGYYLCGQGYRDRYSCVQSASGTGAQGKQEGGSGSARRRRREYEVSDACLNGRRE